jgi:hypothetical protein
VPFQPEAVSQANGRLVKPGDEVTELAWFEFRPVFLSTCR